MIILENNSSIGERLKLLRNEFHLSQSEIAKLCFIPRTTYAQYETNIAYPPQQIQIILSKFYKVSLDFLNGLTDSRVICSSEPETNSEQEEYYKNIPLLELSTLTSIRYIKTPYEKVKRGPFCYINSPCRFSEYNINKNDLLLIKRSEKFKVGDLVLLKDNSDFFIGRCIIFDNTVILYSSDFINGFKEFNSDVTFIGKIVEVTISI